VLAEWAPAPRQLSFLVVLGATLVAAAFTLTLPEPAAGEREPWRIQHPRVPREIRTDFARVGLTAATVWGTLALYLSIVPSYARNLLDSKNLALLGAIGALALASSCVAQIVAQRHEGAARRHQPVGLTILGLSLVVLTVAAPLNSLGALLAGAVAAGVGHGLAFLDAQDELNSIAPSERRGEVTAAFICCIYVVVAGAVVVAGLLDLRLSLTVAVGVVASVLAATAFAIAGWQLYDSSRASRSMSKPSRQVPSGARQYSRRRPTGRKPTFS
jgi:hypothetical protein